MSYRKYNHNSYTVSISTESARSNRIHAPDSKISGLQSETIVDIITEANEIRFPNPEINTTQTGTPRPSTIHRIRRS